MTASSITTCLLVFGYHRDSNNSRRDSFGPSVSRRFSLERILLNAYYIEDLKYVNRRLSIPSGLFSPPTEESTFDPRTQPSFLPLFPRTHEYPPSTLLMTLFLVLNLILLTQKESTFPSISASLLHRPSLQRALCSPSRSEIV